MATQKKKTAKKASKPKSGGVKGADDQGFGRIIAGWFLLAIGALLLLGCISSVYSGENGNWLGPYLGGIVPHAITLLFGKVAVILFTFALVSWGVTLAFAGKILRCSVGLSLLTLNVAFLLALKSYGETRVADEVLLSNGGLVGQFFTQNVWVSIFGTASALAPLGILVVTLGLILIVSFGLRPRHFGFLVQGSKWMTSQLSRKKDEVEEAEPVEATIVEPSRKKSKEYVEEPAVSSRKGIYMDDNTVFLEPDEFKIKRKGVLSPFNGRKNWLDQDMSLESISDMPGEDVDIGKDTFVKEPEVPQTMASEGPSSAGAEYDKNEDPEIRRLEEYLRLNSRKMNALEIVEVKEKISALRRAGDLIAWEKDRKGRMQVKGDVRREGAVANAAGSTLPPQAEDAAPVDTPVATPVAASVASPVTGRNTVLSRNILRKNEVPEVASEQPVVNAEDLLGGDGAATEFDNAPESDDDTFAPVVYGADEDEPQEEPEFQDKTLVPSGMASTMKAASIPVREPTAYDEYKVPTISEILNDHEVQTADYTEDELNAIGKMLEEKLENFKVKGRVIGCETGPMITRFEVEPGPGVKVSRFTALQEDLAMPLRVSSVRILAPIPGKAAVGIEIPNRKFQTVFSKDVFESEKFAPTPEKIQVALGKDITGEAFTMDLAKAPHLLIAGQTGSGKSVCINALMASMLFSKTPDELRMILVDPKAVELKMYENIPHLLAPVITKPEIAIQALQWLCYEMDRRTEVLATAKVRNIGGFNAKYEAGELPDGIPDEDKGHRMPFIVVIIDEMADLMMVAGKEIEKSVARLAAKARAVGIHLVLATQRPSVKVITGIIKANLPTRISFKVASQIDARTVMDHAGAEKLLGRGDMLFKAVNDPDPVRVHGAYLSDEEAEKLADACSNQNVFYPQVESFDVSEGVGEDDDGEGGKQLGKLDPLLFDVACWAIEVSGLSTSAVQRHFSVGYSRAGKIVDQLYGLGVCGPSKGNSKPRAMLVGMDELMQMERSGTFR
ncbi:MULTISPECIES: DNA translocase FtsK [unclassified Fibrobacter]|uniref:DNA translocase FtsK n=1 Tax=unclassified Fibrobacter TaxID=2634177 RepID=UPI000D6A88D9|nr:MULTISPECIES: DNA translocase FtsK [unclassified Fibrobacter]PWJ68248.1 S-DNA-T family DNA segregation ATPase FtsK/SpoIIIE [Fibrobacter sp. UWR4]PZW72606.1 S-DNA-T family DNA segregation ATPase FtsK/SpoIIIE [Fibrobacter sp. UWR1]